MEAKHTPGPWSELTGTITGPDGDEIAEVVGGDGGRYLDDDANAECAANARLIAASPEMLEALRDTLAWMEDCLMDRQQRGLPSREAYETVRTAIAKATAD